MLRALDARYIRPAPGGDILRTPAVLPTGRNMHGFDPFRIPSAMAVRDGKVQAQLLIDRHCVDGNPLPESIAMVLWGSDNLKNEGAPIAQALALMGAMPRFDTYGRIAGATLIPLEELGRPRIDVIMTLSGIFRDLMPLQIKLLAEAAYLAASADEPLEMNWIRKHALAYQQEHGCTLETAFMATQRVPTVPTSTTWSRAAVGVMKANWLKPTSVAKVLPMGERAEQCSKQHCYKQP
jgi:magnesium chelatase subunit H